MCIMLDMNELDVFFKEQEERMTASDEDLDDYFTRLSEEKQRYGRSVTSLSPTGAIHVVALTLYCQERTYSCQTGK